MSSDVLSHIKAESETTNVESEAQHKTDSDGSGLPSSDALIHVEEDKVKS